MMVKYMLRWVVLAQTYWNRDGGNSPPLTTREKGSGVVNIADCTDQTK